jgi:DNA-binding CsgD family transcriptional regulator
VAVLRETARAEAAAGSEAACLRLEEALRLAGDPRERAEIAVEVAEAYAGLFRWVEAVDVIERALAELGEVDEDLAARLEGELVVCGVHDARRASRVAPVLERLATRSLPGSAVEALAVATGMSTLLAGRPVDEAAAPLEHALSRAAPGAENWDTRAALLWSLVTAERFDARGRLRLAQGRPAEALADFERCLEMFSAAVWGTAMRDVGYLHARAGAAQALLRLGERESASEMAQAELADVRVFGGVRAIGVAARVAGLAAGGQAGIELLEESVAALRASPARLELAHSLTELGAALRRGGGRAAAGELLGEAVELAVRCGARRLAGRAREELKATGARPRREWRTGVQALTPSELRIVRLAAAGRTNREIAHELYVTLKTVEGHLSRAYTKLGIEGRGELPGVLEEEKTRVATL